MKTKESALELELEQKEILIESLSAQNDVLMQWVKLHQKGGTIVSGIKRRKLKNIVLYEANKLGVLFCRAVKDSDVNVICGISQDRPILELPIPLYGKEKLLELAHEIDAVVVTDIFYYDEIYDEIRGMLPPNVEILSVADFIYDGLIALENRFAGNESFYEIYK